MSNCRNRFLFFVFTTRVYLVTIRFCDKLDNLKKKEPLLSLSPLIQPLRYQPSMSSAKYQIPEAGHKYKWYKLLTTILINKLDCFYYYIFCLVISNNNKIYIVSFVQKLHKEGLLPTGLPRLVFFLIRANLQYFRFFFLFFP